MKPLAEIHEFIHSLTGSEKRYISAQIKGDSVNGKLFQYLMRSPIPLDPDVAKEEMGYASNYAGFLRITRYLEDRVFDLIKQYDHRSSINAQLTHAVQDVELLYCRGFYARADKIVMQAKKQAWKVEKLELLLELLRWQHKIIMSSYELDRQIPALRAVYEEQQIVISKLENLNQYMLLEEEVLIRFRREYFSRELENKIDISSPLLLSTAQPKCIRAQYFYHAIRGLTFFYNDEMNEAEGEYAKLNTLAVRYPFLQGVYLEDYLSAMLSWLRSKYWHGDLEGASRLMHELETGSLIDKLPQARRNQFFQVLYNYRLIIYEDRREIDKAVTLIPKIQALIDSGTVDPISRDVFYYNFAILYLDAGDISQARHYLQVILQKPPKQVREDIYVFAQIMELLVLYDSNDLELLDYRIKSTYRFLNNRKRIYKFESLLMEFLRQLPKARTSGKLVDLMTRLKDQIELLKQERFEQKATKYYDFTGWLDLKIASLNK